MVRQPTPDRDEIIRRDPPAATRVPLAGPLLLAWMPFWYLVWLGIMAAGGVFGLLRTARTAAHVACGSSPFAISCCE